MRYLGRPDFPHGKTPAAAVVLVNLGTPEAPEGGPVRRYLAEFLADPRVVEWPRWLWRLVLYGVILRLRPRRSAAAYRRIWTAEGSPLLVHSERLGAATDRQLAASAAGPVLVRT